MIIFDGKDIVVRTCLFDRSTDRLVITFTGRAASPPVKMGFGENYLMKRQISAVHFISKDNHWYQTPEPLQAIDEIERLGLLAGRSLTLYGSSMGAYLALMVSRRVKASRLILFSPQYSIDAKRVPFEARWRNYAAKLKFDYDDMAAGIDHEADIKAVFDPFYGPDTQHIELIEALRPIDRIAVPFAGHNTARALEELGIVTKITDQLLAGSFDGPEFRRMYREQRPGSSLFWHGFSETLERRGHRAGASLGALIAGQIMSNSGRMKDPVLRRDMLRHAIRAACEMGKLKLARSWVDAIEPLEKHLYQHLHLRALLARAEGDWPAVLSCCNAALAEKAEDSSNLALKLEATLELDKPEAVLSWCEQHPGLLARSAGLLMAQAQAQAVAERWQAALETLRLVNRIDRRLPRARVLAAQCWTALGRPDAAEKQLAPVLAYDVADDRLAGIIKQLLIDGGAHKVAAKFMARQERFQSLSDSVMNAFEGLDWLQWPAQVPELSRRFLSRD